MPKIAVPLTDMKISKAKVGSRNYKLSDGGGLYLQVQTVGSKLWRLKYRFGGVEKLLALGSYPAVSLADARNKREAAKDMLHRGVDPGEARKAEKSATDGATANSFEVVAREWHLKFLRDKSESHRVKTLANFERDVFPWIGARPVGAVTAPELLTVLRRIEGRGALETAHRTRSACSQVLRYAIATGRAERDSAADLRGALPPYKKGNHAAIIDPPGVAALLRAIDGFHCSVVVKAALRISPYVFVRPGELRRAEWAEVDFAAEQWVIPGDRMKMKLPHIVPLCRQSVEILKELQQLTGRGRYVFPCHRTALKPLSENAVLAALRRMGYDKTEMTGHGFRAMARTILDEVLNFRVDIIEHQLAHAVKDVNGRAYNRTSHLAERRRMMQVWADYLDELRSGFEK